MDVLVRMCESCVKKLSSRAYKGAIRLESEGSQLCANYSCYNLGTFAVHLHLSERRWKSEVQEL